ncbi:MAG: hypothetical protein IAF02_08180 [Anaerolineae bacterium]|nr:hypothetical protein [Anaerolineae bacterium]
MMFSWIKLPVISGITAVFLIFILLSSTACGSEQEPAWAVPLPTPVPATTIPLVATAVTAPTNTSMPTPATQFRHNAEQVLFVPGSSSATLVHELDANDSYRYILYGRVGQLLTIHITASHDGMTFTILDGNNQEIASANGSGTITVNLPQDGDYFIETTAPGENGRRYGCSLEVILTAGITVPTTTTSDTALLPPTTIPPTFSPALPIATAVPPPELITFAPDKTTATLSGQLDNNTSLPYLLPAQAGQTLTIYANASQPGILVSIVGQDNTPFGEFRSSGSFSVTLPTTQNYIINLTPQPGNISLDYSMTVALSNSSSSPGTGQNRIVVESNPATYNDTLYHNTGRTYIRAAEKGQTLLIDSTPTGSNITITVRGEDEITLGWVTAGNQFSAILPSTQAYTINLMPPVDANNIDYTITITVR